LIEQHEPAEQPEGVFRLLLSADAPVIDALDAIAHPLERRC
jgi:hypothetical protein